MNAKKLLGRIGNGALIGLKGAVAVGSELATTPAGSAILNSATGGNLALAVTILRAIDAAAKKGGTGPEKKANAMEMVSVSAAHVIQSLEEIYQVEIEEDVAMEYVSREIDSTVKLLKAIGRADVT